MGNDKKKQGLDPKAQEAAIKKLLEQGKKDGKIEQREIFKIIPDTPENIDKLEAIYSELTEDSIELVEATEPNADEFSDEWVEEEEEVVVPEQVYLDDIADDSVRLYLREIGKIPLLKPD